MGYTRYAIYYTPAPGPLADFGAAWLGWDAAYGRLVAHPDVPGLPLPVSEITATPRKYGMHATIKPPFRLAEGHSAADLADAVARFCAARAPIRLDGLELAPLGRFLALVPEGDTRALNRMAADAVARLDGFRAPLTEAEIARRRKAGLTPGPEAMLMRWGYPYVGDEFRFHITLSGKLCKAHVETVRSVLDPVLADLLPHPVEIDGLALMGEDDAGRFHLIHRYTFSA